MTHLVEWPPCDFSLGLTLGPLPHVPLPHVGDVFGALYMGHSVEKDPKKAAEWFLRSARDGSVHGLVALGRMYENGEGVEKDMEKARAFYKLACAGAEAAQLAAERLRKLEEEYGK